MDPSDPPDPRQQQARRRIDSGVLTHLVYGVVYLCRGPEVSIQTYHRRGRNPIEDPPITGSGCSDVSPPFGGPSDLSLVKGEEEVDHLSMPLLNEIFDDSESQQFLTYQRRSKYQKT